MSTDLLSFDHPSVLLFCFFIVEKYTDQGGGAGAFISCVVVYIINNLCSLEWNEEEDEYIYSRYGDKIFAIYIRGVSGKFVDTANNTRIVYHRIMNFCKTK